MLWVPRTGTPERDPTERFSRWQRNCDRFSRWREAGTFKRIVTALCIRLDRRGKIDSDLP
jgi:transposase